MNLSIAMNESRTRRPFVATVFFSGRSLSRVTFLLLFILIAFVGRARAFRVVEDNSQQHIFCNRT